VECGAPRAALLCPTCSAEHQPGQKFCGECGTALTGRPTAAPAAAVRKTVTVLFADLSGSTGFGERHDAEVARQVLTRYHALLQETVDAHAGTVAKFLGDGMMATWGVPEVAEDDARRAVAAGVALQQRFEELAVDVEARHGEALALRVGINTGEVVIGEADADLIGDALNVAARLEKACRPGHVLVGEETWRLTRADVGYEALGEITVAGRTQPVAIYEVAVAVDAASDVAAPFVGRDAEMQQLVDVFDDARRAARARLATVLGSPGVGKTRLARELCARLAAQGDARRVELRCDRDGEATFAPVAQLIRDAAGLTEDLEAGAARAAIGALLPDDESDRPRVVDALAGLVGVGPPRSVEETFWGVRRLVEATAAGRPLVVVVDDIQWAEPLLLDLIEHLAEWVAGAAVLVVGLARPELREVRPTLAEPGNPVSAVVVLSGLDAAATEALAAGLLGTGRLPGGLVERLPASTDGNPLFVRELVRMLVDDRVIRRSDDGEWELTIDAHAVDVPPTIQSLLGARVERLPAAERELLELASVVGAEFSLGALRELAGEHAPAAVLLERMRRKELVEPTGTYWGDEPVHRFHHVLIRDAAYRRLLKTTRAELHERVAVWTDRAAADVVGEHEAATAFHYEQAHRYRTELGALDAHTARLGRRAAELLTTAAQRALGRDDLASAGALSSRALALLPESDAAGRADLLVMGCECLLASGDGAAARPLVEELGRSTAGDPRRAAWAGCYSAQLVGLTDPQRLVAADAQAQAAAEVLTELGDGAGQAKAHQVRAGLLARLGRVGDCEQELDLALAAARAADDRRRVTAVLGAAPDAALFGPSPVARAGGRCLDVVRLLRITTASPAVEAASNRCQAVLEALRGRFDVARSMLAAARATAEELGLRHGLAQTELFAGMVELIAGDPRAAIPPLRAAREGLGTLGVGADAGQAAALLATALLAEGEVDEADRMAAESEARAGQNLKTAIGWRVARAEVLAARGDLAAAVALAEHAVEIARATDLVVDHADACVALGALRAQAGDEAGARAARADARRLYDQKGATVPAARLDATGGGVAEPAGAAAQLAPPAVGAGSRAETASNPSTAVSARIAELFVTGRVGEIGALIAEDARTEDRRTLIGDDLVGRADHVANFAAAAALGSGRVSFEPLAVRGSTLALGRTEMVFGDWESAWLSVNELDADGRYARGVMFDERDLGAAAAHLDAWYCAGEGSGHADVIRPWVEHLAAFHARDWDELAGLVRGTEIVDHRGAWGDVGPDAYVERMQRLVATAPDVTMVGRRLRVRGDAGLFTTDVRGTATHGDGHDSTFHCIARPGVLEYFDELDLAAAQARLDELGRGTPAGTGLVTVENAASKAMARLIEHFAAGRFADVGRLFAADVVLEDHRAIVGLDLHGRSPLVGALEVSSDLAPSRNVSCDPVAVRGSSLVLVRSDQDYGEWSATVLILGELGADGAFVRGAWFDADAVHDAIELLDEWYIAGEGAEHAVLVAANAAWFRAMNAFDFDAMRALADPGFVYVDHRPLGTPPLDIEGFIQWQEGYRGVANQATVVDLQVRGRVGFVSVVNRAVDAHGGEVLWPFHVVGVVDADGRTVRSEGFAVEDRAVAFERFEALSRGSGGPAIENAATDVHARVVAALASADDAALAELVAPEFDHDDRRTVGGRDRTDRRGAARARLRLREPGEDWQPPTPLAVRGRRLALSRSVVRTAAGADRASLAIVEADEHGRLLSLTQLDHDALDVALDELDARYVDGEGADHATEARLVSVWMRALVRGDAEAIRGLVAPDFVWVDHKRIGWGTMDIDQVVEMFASLDGLRMTPIVARLLLGDGCTLFTATNHAIDEHGAEVLWSFHALGVNDRSGRTVRIETFDDRDWDAASARFDDLAAESRSPGSDAPTDGRR
jgi:class 3 adenylate cyclase/tetratricopeptide (TPR) repeat protein